MTRVRPLLFSHTAKSNFTIGIRIDIQISDRDIEKFTNLKIYFYSMFIEIVYTHIYRLIHIFCNLIISDSQRYQAHSLFILKTYFSDSWKKYGMEGNKSPCHVQLLQL